MPGSDLMKNLKEDCKMKDLNHYAALAGIFRYPSEGLKEHCPVWKSVILSYDLLLVTKIEPFITLILDKPLSYHQEYYTATFDVQATCYLDIGFILFGEDFKRGIFLMQMKDEQTKAGNDCGTEMPDHLPNILTLLPRIKDAEFAEELIVSLLIPAVHEMILKFGNNNNIYKGLLEMLLRIMETDCPDSAFEEFRISLQGKTWQNENMPPMMKASGEYNFQE